MPCVESIGQIAIAVHDLEAAKDYYERVIGLKFLFDAPPGMAFFACGETRIMLTTLQGNEADHNTSVIYYKVRDINDSVQRMKSLGAEFDQEPTMVAPMPDHELWMAFTRDPDKNLIGIMAEVPTSE